MITAHPPTSRAEATVRLARALARNAGLREAYLAFVRERMPRRESPFHSPEQQTQQHTT